jgi:phosphoglycolate phosphatase
MGMPKAVLFDVDGTLITTGGAGERAWRTAFQERFGVAADIKKYSHDGMTDPNVARQTFRGALGRDPQEDELATLVMAYMMALTVEVERSPSYRVLEGVVDLLESLAGRGVLLGLVSGNIEGAAHLKIAHGGLGRYFAFGGYGSDSADRGELTVNAIRRAALIYGHDLDPAHVFVVGDTPLDVEAATFAGVVSVAVASGAYSADQLRSAGAQHVLPSLASPFPDVGS